MALNVLDEWLVQLYIGDVNLTIIRNRLFNNHSYVDKTTEPKDLKAHLVRRSPRLRYRPVPTTLSVSGYGPTNL